MGRTVRRANRPDGRCSPEIFRSKRKVQMGRMVGGYRHIVTAKLAPFPQYVRRKPVGSGNDAPERSITILVVIIDPILASHAGILKIGLVVAQYHPRFVLLPGATTRDGS